MHILKKQLLQSRLLWLLLVAIVLVLFPFDWLSQVWPAFGQVFDRIFVTARDHAIGHTTLFFIAALFVLFAVPVLRSRPIPYFVLMMLGAVGEEAFQSLSKRHLPSIWDGRDVLFDILGFTIAYIVVLLLSFTGKKRKQQQ